jgi:hypothetical protein
MLKTKLIDIILLLYKIKIKIIKQQQIWAKNRFEKLKNVQEIFNSRNSVLASILNQED